MRRLAALVLTLIALGAESCSQSGPLSEGTAKGGSSGQTPKENEPQAVVLVIDKSGSMRDENRILYAQEAAKAVARQLKDNDFLGIVGFDLSPFVVVSLEAVGKLREAVDSQIDRLKPGGQTYFYPALLEAKRQIERAPTRRKHVILLSDGETRGSQSELIDLVAVMKNECKITTSAVGIGKDADVGIMKRIAQYGGGVFQHSSDPSTLAQIVLEYVTNKTPSVLANGETEKCKEVTLSGGNTQSNVGLEFCTQATQPGRLSNENLAMIFNKCGTVYRAKRDYERAIEYFNQSIQLNPIIAEVFVNRGNVYRDKRDYDRAIQDYDEAIRLNPNYFLALNDRGIAYRAKQDYSRAIQDYDQAIRLDPNYAASFNNRGNVYRDKQDYDRAIQDYDEAIRLNPNYATAFNNRGIAYQTKRDYERAIQDYGRAIELDPKYAAAFNNRGNAYRAKRNYDRAIQDYDEAIRLNPNYALAFNNRGIAYRSKTEYERAIQDSDQAMRLSPSYAAAFNSRGNVYRDMRDYDRAIQDYGEAIRLDPNYALAFNNRGNVHRAKKDYDRAIEDYEQAIRLNPNYSLAFRNLGVVNFSLGRMAQSAEAMDRAVKAAPQNLYAILWRYITVAKENKMEFALLELGEHAAKLKESRWPAPVVNFFLGKLNEKEMYAAAENPDPKKRIEQICEANFYAAEAKLLKGAIEEAIPLLRVSEKDCPPTFIESHGANAELKRLGH